MRIWLHTLDASTGTRLGLLDVRPDTAAQSLITAGKAQKANTGWQAVKNAAAKYFGWAAIVQFAAPAVVSAPTITGLTTVGSTLTSTTGTFTGSPTPTRTRQWKRGAADIVGSVAATYVTQAADVGQAVTCVTTMTNIAGAVSSTSNAITVA